MSESKKLPEWIIERLKRLGFSADWEGYQQYLKEFYEDEVIDDDNCDYDVKDEELNE